MKTSSNTKVIKNKYLFPKVGTVHKLKDYIHSLREFLHKCINYKGKKKWLFSDKNLADTILVTGSKLAPTVMGQLDIVYCQQNALKVTFPLYSAENTCPGSNREEISYKPKLKIIQQNDWDWLAYNF